MHRHSQDGDGSFCHIYPIPTPTLPLKGREFVITELKLVPLISESIPFLPAASLCKAPRLLANALLRCNHNPVPAFALRPVERLVCGSYQFFPAIVFRIGASHPEAGADSQGLFNTRTIGHFDWVSFE